MPPGNGVHFPALRQSEGAQAWATEDFLHSISAHTLKAGYFLLSSTIPHVEIHYGVQKVTM